MADTTPRKLQALILAGRPLGEILLAHGVISADKLSEALAAQAERGGRLGEVLVSMKACSEEQVLKALAAQLELPYQMRLATDEVSPELVKQVPINFAKQARVMPLRMEDGSVVLAMADPLDTGAVDSVRLLLSAQVSPMLVPTQSILDCINAVYDRAKNEAEQLVGDLEAGDLDTVAHELEEPTQDLLDSSDEAPIIRLVNSLLFRAAKERASDIHIEPQEKDICVRFRVDGVLQEVIRPPKRFQNSITSRVKIMGGLNIAEKRLPQDGRITLKIAGKSIDIRVSTIPTSRGFERVVMRLLHKTSVLKSLELNVSYETYKQTGQPDQYYTAGGAEYRF
jgi:general secretion pathway protein E